MSQPRLCLQRLSRDHDVIGFESESEELDRWLQQHALAAQEMDTARTFLLIRGRRMVGYFSLTMGSVLREKAPTRLVRGMPGYPVGTVLLARLAVDHRHQGRGLGALLLTEALRKALAAGEAAAARLVVVDAIDEQAAAFYQHHGFIATPEHPLRLYRRIKDIRASLKTTNSSDTRTH
ncbi:MAG TPA: GNAT family N-acetyltransferase [Acidimicrobiia bacterium]|nr:GNAT family N-acetyltransferase [Acidimicrobiia bacterium]